MGYHIQDIDYETSSRPSASSCNCFFFCSIQYCCVIIQIIHGRQHSNDFLHVTVVIVGSCCLLLFVVVVVVVVLVGGDVVR